MAVAREAAQLLGWVGAKMAKAYDGDLEFHRAIGIPDEHSDPAFAPKTASLLEIANTFRINIERARAMVFTPINIAFWASMYQEAICGARLSMGLDWGDGSKDESDEMLVARNDAASQFFRRREVMEAAKRNAETWDYGTHLVRFVAGASYSHRNRTGEELSVSSGLESMLGAVLMLSYAAFETLAADLWIVAVNKDPTLAAAWLGEASERSIRLATLAGYGFDVSQRMGTVLTQSEGAKAKFQSLADIRTAYAKAFNGEADNCFQPVSELIITEKCRHNLAHRGGVIDATFVKDMRGYPDFANAKIGDRLHLSGSYTQARMLACINVAAALLSFVDTWLDRKGIQ